MDTTAVLILLVSCVVSFGIGRFIMQRRRASQQRLKVQIAQQQKTAVLQDQLQAPPSHNKAKRKRQRQQQAQR